MTLTRTAKGRVLLEMAIDTPRGGEFDSNQEEAYGGNGAYTSRDEIRAQVLEKLAYMIFEGET